MLKRFSEAFLHHIFTVNYSEFISKQFYLTIKHYIVTTNTK